MTNKFQLATLAGGCFWCIESAFNSVKGIELATSGYMGGDASTAIYQLVSLGKTGHAEVVQLKYDPKIISYRELLEIFFTLHNPTQLNQQGYDIGAQYRSAIFYHDELQENQAREVIKEIVADGIWQDPIVTEVVKQSDFFIGEELHQDYYNNNQENRYCQAVITPKLAKFRQTFVNHLR
jgi:peptide-methionine (S)-S-oxide reductase